MHFIRPLYNHINELSLLHQWSQTHQFLIVCVLKVAKQEVLWESPSSEGSCSPAHSFTGSTVNFLRFLQSLKGTKVKIQSRKICFELTLWKMSVSGIPYHPLNARSSLVPLYVKMLNAVHKVNPFALHFILRCVREQHQCQGFLSNKFPYFAAKFSLSEGRAEAACRNSKAYGGCMFLHVLIYISINISFRYIYLYKFICLYTIYMVYIFIYLCICLYIRNIFLYKYIFI